MAMDLASVIGHLLREDRGPAAPARPGVVRRRNGRRGNEGGQVVILRRPILRSWGKR